MKRLPRRVDPELLDALTATDPEAIRSRRDLQRLNTWMRQPSSVARLLSAYGATRGMRRLVDLGGGDGTLLLRLARRLAARGVRAQAVVVDRQPSVGAATREALRALGWSVDVVAADVFEWLDQTPKEPDTVIVSNLFLHHFRDDALDALLAGVSTRAELLVACEPRRSRFTLAASRLVGWIGCNAVTRHDAVVSVRAGFIDREISARWPASSDWRLEEGPVGPFSHYFVAAGARRHG